jgi:hypothetical protein
MMDLQLKEFLLFQLGKAIGAMCASDDTGLNSLGQEIHDAVDAKLYAYGEVKWSPIEPLKNA